MLRLCYIWHVCYLSFVYMLASHCIWHTLVTLPYIPLLHCIGYMLCIVYGIHTLHYVWFRVLNQTWGMRYVCTWSDEMYLNPRAPTLLIQHDRVCSIHLFCAFILYRFAHLAPSAITHWNARLMARGSRAILPWVCSMIGRLVVQIFALKCIDMLCLSSTAAKTGFYRKIWSTDHFQCRSAKYCWPRAS